ncbi:MAG: hypothetical protein MK052_00260 [Alphaproteobacteria bacterium]|nr:hypothetical protein [Alphaproteobacteria bacterium]
MQIIKNIKNLALFTVCCIGLSACVSTPMPINNAAIDYGDGNAKIRVDLAEVLVVNDSPTTAATQDLSQYGQSPEAALKEWAANRIAAVGRSGSFSIIIKDANFAINRLAIDDGFGGWFKRQQEQRWDAYLNVMIAVDGSASMLPPGEITISVRSSQTLPEEASEEEKQQTYASVLNKLMTLFDAEAKKQMDQYFRAYYM